MTDTIQAALASPLDTLRASITAAMENEEAIYQDRLAALQAEHMENMSRMQAALDNLGGPLEPTNGHAPVIGTLVVDLGLNGAAPAPAPAAAPTLPEVQPGDVEIDPTQMTMTMMVEAVMGARRGEVWRAENVMEALRRAGYQGGRDDKSTLGSVRAVLSQLARNGTLRRDVPGEFVMP